MNETAGRAGKGGKRRGLGLGDSIAVGPVQATWLAGPPAGWTALAECLASSATTPRRTRHGQLDGPDASAALARSLPLSSLAVRTQPAVLASSCLGLLGPFRPPLYELSSTLVDRVEEGPRRAAGNVRQGPSQRKSPPAKSRVVGLPGGRAQELDGSQPRLPTTRSGGLPFDLAHRNCPERTRA